MAAHQTNRLRCPRGMHEVTTHRLLVLDKKARKRLHVGCTNLSKSASVPALHQELGDENAAMAKLSTLSVVHQAKLTNQRSGHASSSKAAVMALAPVPAAAASPPVPPRPHTSHEMTATKDNLGHVDNAQAPVLTMMHRRSESDRSLLSSLKDQQQLDVDDKETQDKNSPLAKASFAKNRDKLRDRVATKFGSLRAMFRAFDTLGSGGISLEQFHASIAGLGLDITDADERLLYQTVDTNGNNSIDFKEFSAMFEVEPMRNSFVDTGNSAERLKATRKPRLQVSPRTKVRIKAFQDTLSHTLLKKHVSQQVAYGSNSKVLLNAFRHMDVDGDGSLSYDELKNALGPQMLDLEVDPAELQVMINTIDDDKNGFISYKEFVKFFSLKPDIDQDDIFHIGRQRELALLASRHTTRDEPLPFIDFDDKGKHLAPLVAGASSSSSTTTTSSRTTEPNDPRGLHERLARRTLDQFTAMSSSSSSSPDQPLESPHKSPRELDALFASLAPVSASKGRSTAPIEWSRIGVGGNDGVNKQSALYLAESERFVTTNDEQFGPMSKDRPRAGLPQHDLDKQARRLKGRHATTSHNIARIDHNNAQRKLQSQLEDKARLRGKSKQRHAYSNGVIQTEEKLFQHKNHMAKKPGGSSFHRMWAGSLESQFNSQPWGVSTAATVQPTPARPL
ncbi:hypothetical protein H257_17780 [Aphanomyces astaci]|uniref:EF-hand domain-containing protein n=1 Tax=Aphanomyces astaci TaxID=112090 RepID=W4FF48_APHAT|nr:hypothetical protein H257_17780 [Aphanomyces astaci]ETV65514.1 hypothetical protein H257_17780 [Aphanomyces astaci]|eukprot:XP_009845002.1 hypothetical protein H257_17780 [Aphanomyces astaci]